MNGLIRPEASNLIILVLHPSNAPNVFTADGALEFEEERSIALPDQKLFKDSIIGVLTEFAGFRQSPELRLEARLRVDSRHGTEFPATHVVRLVGVNVNVEDVAIFRAAAQFAIQQLVPQIPIGEVSVDHLLAQDEKVFLTERGRAVAKKFANKSITRGFMVWFGPGDTTGVTVQGVMPSLSLDEKANATINGRGRPIGFDETNGTITLNCTDAANDSEERIMASTKLVFRCPDARMFTTIAKAYVNRSHVSFIALSQRDAKQKRDVITLTQLREVAAKDPDSYELESPV